jgi:hypothetical protein
VIAILGVSGEKELDGKELLVEFGTGGERRKVTRFSRDRRGCRVYAFASTKLDRCIALPTHFP